MEISNFVLWAVVIWGFLHIVDEQVTRFWTICPVRERKRKRIVWFVSVVAAAISIVILYDRYRQ